MKKFLVFVLLLMISFTAYSSSIGIVVIKRRDGTLERHFRNIRGISDDYARELEALSPEDLRLVEDITKDPVGFLANGNYKASTHMKPIFLKTFLMKLENNPALMDDIANIWRHVQRGSDHIIDEQIDFLLKHGVDRDLIGSSVLASSLRYQKEFHNRSLLTHFQNLFPSTVRNKNSLVKIIHGDFIAKGKKGISHEQHGKNLITFLDEVILLPVNSATRSDYWKPFNKMFPPSFRAEHFGRLLAKVWDELMGLEKQFLAGVEYEKKILGPMEKVFFTKVDEMSAGMTGRVEAWSGDHSFAYLKEYSVNMNIMNHAARRNESFGEFYYSNLVLK